jgi:hypothetical protein
MTDREKIERLKTKLLEYRPSRPTDHYHVDEDAWYSCPQHPEAIKRDDPKWDNKCQCDFERKQKSIDDLLREIGEDE